MSDRQKNIEHDAEVLREFVGVFCRQEHKTAEGLCVGCQALLDYAIERRRKCPFDPKPTCKSCSIHCYQEPYRTAIRAVMKTGGLHYLKRGRLDKIFLLAIGRGGKKDEEVSETEMQEELIGEMMGVFGDDQRRIDHALSVLAYAQEILASEPQAQASVVTAAAILHDIGIHAAQERHQSTAGQWQELEGPPIAREILERLGWESVQVEHVCRIVGNHHSAREIDTIEFRIVWDADWLVNIPEEMAGADRSALEAVINRVFKTASGKRRATELFLTERKTQ